MTGHFMAATAAGEADLEVTRDTGLRWYQSSAAARRGFCNLCGSTLFWHGRGRDYISIAAGSFDGATGLTLVQHIFTAEKGGGLKPLSTPWR